VLAVAEANLATVLARESVLKNIIRGLDYDCILIDTMPALGSITINALTASNSVLIPVQTHYLALEGLNATLKLVSNIRKNLNPRLEITGLLCTFVNQTLVTREAIETLNTHYGQRLKIFDAKIPITTRAIEATAHGISMLAYSSESKVTKAYAALADEVEISISLKAREPESFAPRAKTGEAR
jgi:chromosome partitioning protein